VRFLRILIPLLLLPVGPALSAQQGYVLGSVGVVPARFYVGDLVQVYVRVSVESNMELRPPGTFPPAPDLELREVMCTRIREGEWEVQIHFVSFKPGKFAVPGLDLGGIRLRGIELETRSVLEDKGEAELKPPRRQLVIPGTWLKAALLAGFLVLFPPFLIFLWRLAKELARMDGRRFFTELTHAIRAYLTTRLTFPADKATTLEIGRILPDRLPADSLAQGAASGIAALLERGDHVKFGGRPCRRKEMERALQRIEELVNIVEEVENRVES
jgi:hypothetical protein